jgi:hypothetical protein
MELPASDPLFVYSGPRKLLGTMLCLFLSIFTILMLIAYLEQTELAVDAILADGVLVLTDFVFLLFSRDIEFYNNFLQIIDFTQTRIVPYWEIEYRIISSMKLRDHSQTIRSN